MPSPESGPRVESNESANERDMTLDEFKELFNDEEGSTQTEQGLGSVAMGGSVDGEPAQSSKENDYSIYTPDQAVKFHKELSSDKVGIDADIKRIEEQASWGGLDADAASELASLKARRDNYDEALRELAIIGGLQPEATATAEDKSERTNASQSRNAEGSHAKMVHGAVTEGAGQAAHAVRTAAKRVQGFAKKIVAKDEEASQPAGGDNETSGTKQAAKQSHSEFVKQQKELWGANDKVAPEDVPEGEMTYEQYLAQRPTAQDGDVYRVNGRFHDAKTGAFSTESAVTSGVSTSDSDRYFDKNTGEPQVVRGVRTASAEEYYKDRAENQLEADRQRGEAARDAIESEIIANKDPKSKSLLGLSGIINQLREQLRDTDDDTAKEKLQSQLDAFLGTFDDLSGLYAADIDPRALKYAKDMLNEDPDKRPSKGFVYLEGRKVEATDYSELAGNKEYTIAEDGLERQVTDDQLEFRLEELAESPEQAPKSWWKRVGEKMRTVMGAAYWAAKWEVFKHDSRENLASARDLERGIDDSMTEQEKEKRRRRNRVVKVLGISAGVIAGVGVIAGGALLIAKGISDGQELANAHNGGLGIGLGEHNDWTQANGLHPTGTDALGGNSLDLGGTGSVDMGTITPDAATDPNSFFTLENFTVPDGGGGQALFEKLHLGADKWFDNAQTLLAQFPQDFELKDGDIRITHPGPLSQAAQDFIKTLR